MSTQKLKLIKTDSEFIEIAGECHSNVLVDGDRWYYLPFWYKKIGEGMYEEYGFEDLPQGLKDFIQKQRNP